VLQLEIIAENYRADRDSFKLDLKLPKGGQIELFSFTNSLPRPSYPEALGLRHLAFCVDSVEKVRQYLLDNGIEVEPVRVDEFTDKKFTFFNDPDGLPLELYQCS
jgi:glyoxylase I family protein